MTKSIWPHHISCACQACDMHRHTDLPQVTRWQTWQEINRPRPRPGEHMNLRRSALAALAGLAAVTAGCSSGPPTVETIAAPEAAGRVSTPFTVVTEAPTTTTAAPTTTTVAPTTTTRPRTVATVQAMVTPPTTRLPVATVAAPTCSVRALASPVTRNMTQTIYVTSNRPGLTAAVDYKPVTMDGEGNGKISFAGKGGQMDQFGNYTPKVVNVRVRFFTVPWTLNDLVDPPFPPELMSCTTSYLAIGPN